MLFGGVMMSMSPPNESTGIIIFLGLLFFIPGLIIAVVGVGSWLVARLYSSLDIRAKRYVRRGFALLIVGWFTLIAVLAAIRLADAPIDFDRPHFPILAGTWGGDVASPESWADFEIKPLEFVDSIASGATVKLLGYGKTGSPGDIPVSDGFPWFQVEYGDGKSGYMWGGGLCATYSWANGVNRRCPADAGYSPATEAEAQEQQGLLDLIEYSFETLPGTWQRVPDRPTDQIQPIMVIHPQDGSDNHYAQRVHNYYANDVDESTWALFPEYPGVEERFEPNARQLRLKVNSARHAASSFANIVLLDDVELVLSAGEGGQTAAYRRAADPQGLIKAWEEQAAERKRIIAANAPLPEVAKLAPRVIEGLPDAHEQAFEVPFSVRSYAGKIRSGPGTQFRQIGSLTRGGTIQMLAVTDIQWESSIWYRIRHESGLEGYVLGSLLCARAYWLYGVTHHCEDL
jgi:hypothetical protein